jgi:hypothetical protein
MGGWVGPMNIVMAQDVTVAIDASGTQIIDTVVDQYVFVAIRPDTVDGIYLDAKELYFVARRRFLERLQLMRQ